MEKIIFLLIVLFGPTVISIPFVSMFSIDKKLTKKFWIIYAIIIFVITLIWGYIWMTMIPGNPL